MSDVTIPANARSLRHTVVVVIEDDWDYVAPNGAHFYFAKVRPALGIPVQVQVSPTIFELLHACKGTDVEVAIARQYKKRVAGSKYEDKTVDNCSWWVTDVLA